MVHIPQLTCASFNQVPLTKATPDDGLATVTRKVRIIEINDRETTDKQPPIAYRMIM